MVPSWHHVIKFPDFLLDLTTNFRFEGKHWWDLPINLSIKYDVKLRHGVNQVCLDVGSAVQFWPPDHERVLIEDGFGAPHPPDARCKKARSQQGYAALAEILNRVMVWGPRCHSSTTTSLKCYGVWCCCGIRNPEYSSRNPKSPNQTGIKNSSTTDKVLNPVLRLSWVPLHETCFWLT